jgi:hypothetical protein
MQSPRGYADAVKRVLGYIILAQSRLSYYDYPPLTKTADTANTGSYSPGSIFLTIPNSS